MVFRRPLRKRQATSAVTASRRVAVADMAKSSIDIAESLARLSASTIFELRRVAAAALGAAAHAVVPCATFHSNHSCDGTGLRVNQALCSESGFCCNLQSRIRLAIPRRQCIPGSRNRPAVKSELLRHWVACRSELSVLTILSPTLAKPSRDVRCSYEGERRPASEKRANFAETLALSCLHQRQAFVFRDRAIEGLAVVPPEDDLFRSRFRDDGRGKPRWLLPRLATRRRRCYDNTGVI